MITAKEATALILNGIKEGEYESAKIALDNLRFGDEAVNNLRIREDTISFETWAGNTVSVTICR